MGSFSWIFFGHPCISLICYGHPCIFTNQGRVIVVAIRSSRNAKFRIRPFTSFRRNMQSRIYRLRRTAQQILHFTLANTPRFVFFSSRISRSCDSTFNEPFRRRISCVPLRTGSPIDRHTRHSIADKRPSRKKKRETLRVTEEEFLQVWESGMCSAWQNLKGIDKF